MLRRYSNHPFSDMFRIQVIVIFIFELINNILHTGSPLWWILWHLSFQALLTQAWAFFLFVFLGSCCFFFFDNSYMHTLFFFPWADHGHWWWRERCWDASAGFIQCRPWERIWEGQVCGKSDRIQQRWRWSGRSHIQVCLLSHRVHSFHWFENPGCGS